MRQQEHYTNVDCKEVGVDLQKVVLHFRLDELEPVVGVHVPLVHNVDKHHYEENENKHVGHFEPVEGNETPALEHYDQLELDGKSRTS